MNAVDQMTLGTVFSMNTAHATCDVVLESGGILYNVGIMNAQGGYLSDDINPVPNLVGAQVLLLQIRNIWYVSGTLPVPASPATATSGSATHTQTGTDNPDTYGKAPYGTPDDYSQGRMTGYMPGDKVLSTDGGSTMLLGSDGLVVLKASELAQIILGAYKDFMRIIAREFSLHTDFGTVDFLGGGPSGRTGMAIKGGANFCDEAGTNDPIWTCKVFLGDVPGDPDARCAVYVYNTDRSEFVRRVADITGCQFTEMSKDNDVEIGQDETVNIGRDRTVAVHQNDTLTVDADRTATIHQNDSLTVDANRTTSIAGNQSTEVQGEQSQKVAGKRAVEAQADEDHQTAGTLQLKTGNLIISTGGFTLTSDGSFGGSQTCDVTVTGLNFKKA